MAIKINENAWVERYAEIEEYLPKTPSDLIQAIALSANIMVDSIKYGSRKKELIIARHYAQWLIKVRFKISLREIGLHFNSKDHSTIIHAIKSIEGKFSINERRIMFFHKNFLSHLRADVYSFQEFARPIKNAIFA